MGETQGAVEVLASEDILVVERFASQALSLGLDLLEYFYTDDPDVFPDDHPVSDLWHNIHQVGEDQSVREAKLAKALLEPMDIFFVQDRFEEDDMPPRELEPGKYISLYERDGDKRVTINIYGPVRRVIGLDEHDSVQAVQRAGNHTFRTEGILDNPGVLRVKVGWGREPHQEFTLRFQAVNNRLLFALCNVGGDTGQTGSDVANFYRRDNRYTKEFYEKLITLAGQARTLPFVNQSRSLPEFYPHEGQENSG